MKCQILATTLLIGGLAAAPLFAQTASPGTIVGSTTGAGSTATTPSTGPSSGTTGAFSRLSPGNQKIARDLFNAQTVTSTSGTSMSLDQIAAAKTHEGWGEVFHQMKAEGLVQAKNLGQVVSGRYSTTAGMTAGSSAGTAAGAAAGRTAGGSSTVITNGSGRTVTYGASGKGSPSGGIITASGGAVTAGAGAGSGGAAGASAASRGNGGGNGGGSGGGSSRGR